MTTRREFLLALGAVSAPGVSVAQPSGKMVRLGFLGAASPAGYATRIDAFRGGLRELGYVEGKNYTIEFRWAHDDFDQLPGLAAELVRLNPDIIVTHGAAPSRAAHQSTRTIPIVITAGVDPVETGLVASYARPGGNVTGSSNLTRELGAKRLEVLKETLPHVSRVALLFNPASADAPANRAVMDAAGKRLKIELRHVGAKSPADIPSAFAEMRKQIEAVTMNENPMLIANAKLIAEVATKVRIPTMAFREVAQSGGLMAYGVNTLELWRRGAHFVDRIAKGAKPGDIPIEQASKFELILNARTAKALGITFPQQVLFRADEVIE